MQSGEGKVERLLHPGPVLSKQYLRSHLAVVQPQCLCIFVLKNRCGLTGVQERILSVSFQAEDAEAGPSFVELTVQKWAFDTWLARWLGTEAVEIFWDQAVNEVVLLGHSSDLHTSCFYWSTWGLLFMLVNKPLSVSSSNLESLLPSIGNRQVQQWHFLLVCVQLHTFFFFLSWVTELYQ